MNFYLKVLLLTLSTVLIQHFSRFFYIVQGWGNSLLKHYPGDCHVVSGFSTYGSEDMTLLPDGKVLISSGMFGLQPNFDYSKSQAKGIIYIMDTNKSFTSVEKLDVVGWPESAHFEPHGIHYWEHQNKSVSVFVILHMPEVVARFTYDGRKTLTLSKVYEDKQLFRDLNGIFVTSEDSFYVTNIFHARHQVQPS
ncbi:PON3 [Bugula neritina]|uniref:PON3 n=1 Tax=Bugula neritina TaxID=10212 RepID=A0A7J7K818_BUGNE|nr:PON3 [Bugula neritina]